MNAIQKLDIGFDLIVGEHIIEMPDGMKFLYVGGDTLWAVGLTESMGEPQKPESVSKIYRRKWTECSLNEIMRSDKHGLVWKNVDGGWSNIKHGANMLVKIIETGEIARVEFLEYSNGKIKCKYIDNGIIGYIETTMVLKVSIDKDV